MLLALVALLGTPGPDTEAPRPNIVVVLTDDAGYSDLGCYGGEIRTPHIDRMAEAGLRFRRCYNQGRCSPTRAALLTGHDPHTVGVGELARPDNATPLRAYRARLDPHHPTLAELLRDAGYHTFMVGKWHLGGRARGPGIEPWGGPTARGFDRFFGLFPGQTGKLAPDPIPYVLDTEVYDARAHPGGFYSERAYVDFALDFLRGAREADDRPFFLYVAFSSPHPPYEVPEGRTAPYEDVYRFDRLAELRRARLQRLKELGAAPPEWVDNEAAHHRAFRIRFYDKSEPRRSALERDLAKFAAMLEVVDENVGRIVAELERTGELDDTIFFVLSDNGAGGPPGEVFNAPFRGSKNQLREAGVLTHLVVHWPAGLRASGWTEQVAHVADIAPTCLELAGATYPAEFRGAATRPLAGISLAGVLGGGPAEPRPLLAWDLEGQRSVVRDGRWKWLLDEAGEEHLYDLERDGTETTNLLAEEAERVAALKEAHRAYAARVGALPHDVVQAWKHGGARRAMADYLLALANRFTRAETRWRALFDLTALVRLRLGAASGPRRDR